MEITYKIDKVQKIIFEIWPKTVSFGDYKNVKKREFEDSDFDVEYDVVTDLRNVEPVSDNFFALKVVSFMKENCDLMKNRKSAIVADSPQTVATSLYLGKKARDLSVKVSVFSSVEAAVKWIKEKWH